MAISLLSTIQQFFDCHQNKILALQIDDQGKESLGLVNRNFWSCFLIRVIGIKRYQLETIANYIQNHQEELNRLSLQNGKSTEDFYRLINGKIERYNKRHFFTIQPILSRTFANSHSTPPLSPSTQPLPPNVSSLISSLTPQANRLIKDRSSAISQQIGPLPVTPQTLKPVPSLPPIPSFDSHSLIFFHLEQQGKIQDLAQSLDTHPENLDTVKKLIRIEKNQFRYVEAWLKLKKKREVTIDEIAHFLGQSLASTRGTLIGQATQEALFSWENQRLLLQFSQDLLSILKELYLNENDPLFSLWIEWKKSSGDVLDLTTLSHQMNLSHQSLIQKMGQLIALAQENPLLAQKIEAFQEKLDEKICAKLRITKEEKKNWLEAINCQLQLEMILTQLSSLVHTSSLSEYPIYDLEAFLNQIHHSITSFRKPSHLLKLQSLFIFLKNHPTISPHTTKWKEILQLCINQILHQLNRQGQETWSELSDSLDGLEEVCSQARTVFYRPNSLATENFQFSSLKSKIQYIQNESTELIIVLTEKMDQLNQHTIFDLEQLEKILTFIPPSLRHIFLQMATDKAKKKQIQIIIQKFALTDQKTKTSLEQFLDQAGFIETRGKRLTFKRTVRSGGLSQSQRLTPKTIVNKTSARDLLSPQQIESANKLDDENLPEIDSSSLKEDTINALKIVIDKLKRVEKRQNNRLQKLQTNQTVIIPQYFHSTNLEASISIVQSGIEAVTSTSGFGAFISNRPEFRYGPVTIGLPKNNEFAHDLATYIDHTLSPEIIPTPQVVWAGLEQSIILNPDFATLQQEFLENMMALFYQRLHFVKQIIGQENSLQLQFKFAQLLNASVVLRLKEDRRSQKHYCLYHRKSTENQELILIKGSTEFNQWMTSIIKQALEILPSTNNYKKMFGNSREGLLKDLVKEFKQIYPNYPMLKPFKNRSSIPACIIASDNEEILKKIYHRRSKSDHRTNVEPPFYTIDEVQSKFENQGVSATQIEFIPLTEQLIEKDLLDQIDQTVPKTWSVISSS